MSEVLHVSAEATTPEDGMSQMDPQSVTAMVGRMLTEFGHDPGEALAQLGIAYDPGDQLMQEGYDPNDFDQMLDLFAIGLTLRLWRNTDVEDWHAGRVGVLSDSDMMRINSHTTMAIRRRIGAWCTDYQLVSMDDLDELGAGDLAELLEPLERWLIRPTRKLVSGPTLREVAERYLAKCRAEPDHEVPTDETADTVLAAYAKQVEAHITSIINASDRQGVRWALLSSGMFMGSHTERWWGSRTWPTDVDNLMSILNDPGHPHWQRSGYPAAPESLPDRDHLRELLLNRPWMLTSEVADWLIHAVGMTFAMHRATN